jgi:hypothetical protein
MSSWRDETPQHVQDELDELVGVALDAARQFVAKSGEFYPFAVTRRDAEVALVAAVDDAGRVRPDSSALLATLGDGLRADRERLAAVAIVADVFAERGTAIRVEVEHRDGGPALRLLLPYSIGRFRRRAEFGELSAGLGTRQIWDG